MARLASIYCARMGDVEAQYNLGCMYANGRGIARNDALAGFFRAASEQGMEAAQRMLKVLGEHYGDKPECMRDPVVVVAEPVPMQPAAVVTQQVDYRVIAPRKILDLVNLKFSLLFA